jgi:hypothetical protein
MKYQLEYLKILRKFNSHGYPKDMSIDEMSDSEYRAIKELIEGGYLTGNESPAIREGNIKHDISGISGTLKGRVFQDSLEEEIAKRTLLGRLKASLPFFSAILIGVAIASFGKLLDNFPDKPVPTSQPQEHIQSVTNANAEIQNKK